MSFKLMRHFDRFWAFYRCHCVTQFSHLLYHVLATLLPGFTALQGGETLELRREVRSSSTLQSGTKPAVGDSSSSGTTTVHSADPSRLLDEFSFLFDVFFFSPPAE